MSTVRFSTWQDAGGTAVTTASEVSAYSFTEPGLVHISRTTIGTAVSSVTVSDCFSSTYDNYRTIFCVNSASESTGHWLHVKIGTATTGYYSAIIGGTNFSDTYGGDIVSYPYQNQSIGSWVIGFSPATRSSAVMEIQSPFLATQTTLQCMQTNSYSPKFSGVFLNNTDSHTSITFQTAAGTITGGTIDVHGYIK